MRGERENKLRLERRRRIRDLQEQMRHDQVCGFCDEQDGKHLSACPMVTGREGEVD